MEAQGQESRGLSLVRGSVEIHPRQPTTITGGGMHLLVP
jgi:hypothetical protein